MSGLGPLGGKCGLTAGGCLLLAAGPESFPNPCLLPPPGPCHQYTSGRLLPSLPRGQVPPLPHLSITVAREVLILCHLNYLLAASVVSCACSGEVNLGTVAEHKGGGMSNVPV